MMTGAYGDEVDAADADDDRAQDGGDDGCHADGDGDDGVDAVDGQRRGRREHRQLQGRTSGNRPGRGLPPPSSLGQHHRAL